MKTIIASLFDAFLKCSTKCWLRARKETPSGNLYAEWVQSQNESYRAAQIERLLAQTPPSESARSPFAENLKTAKWRLAVDLEMQTPKPPGSRREETPSQNAEVGVQNAESSQSLATSAATTQTAASPPAFIAESHLHAVERVTAEGRGKAAQFVLIRFVFFNKLTKDDKLLLAFDVFVLAQGLGRDVPLGKIIHGDLRDCVRSSRRDEAPSENAAGEVWNGEPSQNFLTSAATSRNGYDDEVDEPATETSASLSAGQPQPRVTKVKTSTLAAEVRKRLDKLATLLASEKAPDLVLNRHCAECEFRDRCRKIAVEKDDLSLLAGMSAKERQKLRSKGIFTVTQLSYTFRPRRRPKRLRDKREKYHHSLKALAIREQKIHIVGILLCYPTGAMRWVGALQVVEHSNDKSPIWTESEFPARLEVKPLIVFEPEHGVPMSELAEKAPFYRNAATFKKFKGFLRGSPKRFKNRRDAEIILRMLYATERTPVSRDLEPKAPPAAAPAEK